MRPDDEYDNETPQTNDIFNASDDMSLALIEEQADHKIRRIWHEGRWFFSAIDVVGILTDAPKPRMYWADMKRRIQSEGFYELLAKCQQLKMRSSDGKNYRTDATDTVTMLRIIQSIPSPKAEPIKQWLAREGAKRLEEQAHPLDPADASAERETMRKPERDASLLVWADYFEQMATLYRRQYAFEAQLQATQDDIEEHSERLEEHGEWLDEHAQRLEGHDTRLDDHDAQLDAVQRDIADAEWEAVAAWFRVRLDAAEKRHNR